MKYVKITQIELVRVSNFKANSPSLLTLKIFLLEAYAKEKRNTASAVNDNSVQCHDKIGCVIMQESEYVM